MSSTRNNRLKYTLPALLCAGCILLLLAACRRPDPDPVQTETPVTLRILSVGSSGKHACQRISDALSQITLEKFGFKVELSQVSMVNYDSYLSASFLSGTQPDMFCFTSTQTLLSYAQDGHATVLEPFIPISSPLRHNNNSEIWQYVRINDYTYAVPSNNALNYCLGFCARADIVQELGVDPSDITDWESLHQLLLLVRAQYPDLTPVVPHTGTLLPGLGQDPLGDNLGVLMNNQGTRVENLYASEEYAEACRRMYQWQQEGLILPRAFACEYASGHTMRLYDGFGFFANINSERLAARICAYGSNLIVFPLSGSIANSSSVNSGWCISPDSPHKQEAIALLELLYTDRNASDLCIYGQEGIDYCRLDENTITMPETSPASVWENVSWVWPNRQIASNWVLPSGNLIAVPDYGAQRSPAMGFMFDTKAVKTQCNQCLAIVAKYDKALLSGYLDPDDALPVFLQELEAAGINEIIKEKQTQLDRWLAQQS